MKLSCQCKIKPLYDEVREALLDDGHGNVRQEWKGYVNEVKDGEVRKSGREDFVVKVTDQKGKSFLLNKGPSLTLGKDSQGKGFYRCDGGNFEMSSDPF